MKLLILICAIVALSAAKSPMSQQYKFVSDSSLSGNSTGFDFASFALLSVQGFSNGFFGSEVDNLKICLNETVGWTLDTWALINKIR